jgi:hypothetical protein
LEYLQNMYLKLQFQGQRQLRPTISPDPRHPIPKDEVLSLPPLDLFRGELKELYHREPTDAVRLTGDSFKHRGCIMLLTKSI